MAPGGATSSGGRAARATSNPSPMAVPPPSCSSAMAALTAGRSSVTGCTREASEEKATTPTRNPSGRVSTKSRAARFAASRREGHMSLAPMLPETSRTSTIVARSLGTPTRRAGRARATVPRASARSSSRGGKWRRKAVEGRPSRAARSKCRLL